ncbi:MAG TPA: hypothetical protein DCE41_30130 [Cytophagales bacterium]|nr:hypothetical protein [Cytophagales bacterium]HAA17930.1 hypothetical protein [Cytophagales bacterium]HAP62762.1 hypothetical protein [Cytophagales bacterium]
MKKLTKVLAALAILVSAGLSSDNITPQVQAESKFVASARVAVIKDWASCYDLIFCHNNERVAATYNGTADFSIPNYYDINYYNGGCGIVVTSVTLSTWCP